MNNDHNNSSVNLSQLDEDFRTAELDDPRSDSEPVLDGSYQVSIERAELRNSSKGNPMLALMLRILGPRFANRVLWRNIVFTQNSVKYAKADLCICGLALTNLSEL